jgi:2-dehydro-3-deoxyphosphogluconate aldolase/(4S)-4-hydroxy-2-oxoglutarate aldolase
MDAVFERIQQGGVAAVLVLEEVRHAEPVARALLAGGVGSIELTLRTEAAVEAARVIRVEVPEMMLGLGTVLTLEQVRLAVEIGADFAVSPGLNPLTVREAQRLGLPFAPGVCTPSDIELAVAEGCGVLKFFPAEPSGGLPYLKAIAAPFAHLGLRYIPLGGIHAGNAAEYLEWEGVLALGGSWLAPDSLIRAEDWESIQLRARQITDLVAFHRNEG